MKPQVKVPELAEAIAAHARAVLAGDSGAAEGHVAPAALEAYRRAMNEAMRQGPFDRHAAPGLARLGSQYISKVRFAGARGVPTALSEIDEPPAARNPVGLYRVGQAAFGGALQACGE